MAEGVGFEPTIELLLCWFSRPVLSTTQPSFLTLLVPTAGLEPARQWPRILSPLCLPIPSRGPTSYLVIKQQSI